MRIRYRSGSDYIAIPSLGIVSAPMQLWYGSTNNSLRVLRADDDSNALRA